MGDKINNVQAMMNNPKKRNLYLMGVGTAIVTLVAGFIYATTGNKTEGSKGAAQIAKIANVQSVPGASTSARYNENVAKANIKDADKALDQGKSFTPTPINKDSITTESPLDSLDKQIKAQKEAEAREQAEKQAQQVVAEPVQPVAPAPQPVVVAQPVLPVQPAPQPKVAPPKPKLYGSDEDFLIMQALNGVGTIKASKSEFNYVGQKIQEQSAVQQGYGQFNNSASNGSSAQKGPMIAKAGTIFNAILETGINSDEPSPVLAKIVSGDLKGTRLIGKVSVSGEKVIVQFNTAAVPEMNASLKLSSVAVDPGTSRTGLASDVDRHYFLRYGVMLSAAFLGGYADAIKNNNQTCTSGVLGGTTCTSNGGLSSKQINQQAVGNLGKELANETRQRVAGLKPTITVEAGTPIGILIMDDLYAGQ